MQVLLTGCHMYLERDEKRRLPHCLLACSLSNLSRTTPVNVSCVSPGTRSTRVIRHATGTRQTRPTTTCLNGREVWRRDSEQTHGEPSSQPTSEHAIARPATASDWVSTSLGGLLLRYFLYFQCPLPRYCDSSIFNCFTFMSFLTTSLHLVSASYLSVSDCPSTSIFHVLNNCLGLFQSFSLRGLIISVSLLLHSHLCFPHLSLLFLLHS